jgi:streptogramin lyase
MKNYFEIAYFSVLIFIGSNAANIDIHSSEYNNTKATADREVQSAPSVVGISQGVGAKKTKKTKNGMPSYPTLKSKGSKPKSPSSPKIPVHTKKHKNAVHTYPKSKSKGSKSKSPSSHPTMPPSKSPSSSPTVHPSKSPSSSPTPLKTYTLDADFDEGSLINVNHAVPNKDQLQLNSAGTPLNFIWIALSGRGTIAKVDTLTGTVLGEYKSAPDGRGTDPSRTTVDLNGNVWAGNRAEGITGGFDSKGSIVHIGLNENAQCVDRNNNGVIDTSTGLGDVKPWTNAGGADDNGGVSTAEDECIIHYTRTIGTGVRTIAIDANNDVWAGGYLNNAYEKINGSTGKANPSDKFYSTCGGYGGLIDNHGVLWSAHFQFYLLRVNISDWWNSEDCILFGYTSYSYGLGIDTNGYIWNSDFETGVRKIAPDGAIVGTFSTGGAGENKGVVVTPADNHVWIANFAGSTVSRLDNSGNIKASIIVGIAPTGLAVDAAGKVWVTNRDSNNAMRIDPSTNLIDLTVDLGDKSAPYDYSDMTGSTLAAPPKSGTWTVTYDSGTVGMDWSMTRLNWNADTPSDSSLTVEVKSSANGGATWSGFVSITKGVDLSGIPPGGLLKIRVIFCRATNGAGPVLFDLTIA